MVSFQIISDLHLKGQALETMRIRSQAPYLALLGSIGPISDAYITFLERNLDNFKIIFVVPGTAEPWSSTWAAAKKRLEKLAHETRVTRGGSREAYPRERGQLVVLDHGRYDVPDSDVTVLGCTLFSGVDDAVVRRRLRFVLPEFTMIRGDWGVDEHVREHGHDLAYLNWQVRRIQLTQPGRTIVILTHHCPTRDPRALDPAVHGIAAEEVDTSFAFATDLSREDCWTSENVKLWAFGRTRYNCNFQDGEKRIYTNQYTVSESEVESWRLPGVELPGFDEVRVITV